MATIAIVEPVPEFFRKRLRGLGFGLLDTTTADLRQATEPTANIKGLVIRSKTFVDASTISVLSGLAFIMRPGSGLDNIDQEAAAQAQVQLINSPEGNRNAVAEHTLGMLLSLLHNITPANQAVREGRWEREVYRGTELQNLLVGIVGYGHTGAAFARKLSGMGCQIMAYDKYRSIPEGDTHVVPAGWQTLAEHADVMSFHVPYTNETHHYFNKAVLSQRTKPVILINTSRGSIVNSQDLLEGLYTKAVSSACLDVLETEDQEAPSTQLKAQTETLKQHPAVLITPHIAGWSHTSEEAIYDDLIEKLKTSYALIER